MLWVRYDDLRRIWWFDGSGFCWNVAIPCSYFLVNNTMAEWMLQLVVGFVSVCIALLFLLCGKSGSHEQPIFSAPQFDFCPMLLLHSISLKPFSSCWWQLISQHASKTARKKQAKHSSNPKSCSFLSCCSWWITYMLSHVVCWGIFLVIYVPCILILVSFSNMWGAQVYADLDY
jgi:hypothetical protein